MSSTLIVATDEHGNPGVVPEQTTAAFKGIFIDELGVAITLAQLTTATLLLYLVDGTTTYINGVGAAPVDIKNVGRGAIASDGSFVITLTPADNVIITTSLSVEIHEMLIQWTFAAGVKAGKQRIRFQVENLVKI